MYIQALVIVVLLGKLMKRVFFGQLRAAEVEVNFSFRTVTCVQKSQEVIVYFSI